jgi:hypothetical protein
MQPLSGAEELGEIFFLYRRPRTAIMEINFGFLEF